MALVFPNQKYNILLVDPPWFYNARKNKKTKFGGGAMGHYPVMKLNEIKALPVNDIADTNCALFLWATWPRLKEALEVMETWGFTYKTLGFNWMKTNKKNSDLFFGIGYYAKSGSEVCLLGIKGKMKPISNKISSSVVAPVQEHSQKPNKIRNRIVRLFGDVPRIEMFARERVDGWDALGYDVGGDDVRHNIHPVN